VQAQNCCPLRHVDGRLACRLYGSGATRAWRAAGVHGHMAWPCHAWAQALPGSLRTSGELRATDSASRSTMGVRVVKCVPVLCTAARATRAMLRDASSKKLQIRCVSLYSATSLYIDVVLGVVKPRLAT
jgi:hypothetical protein